MKRTPIYRSNLRKHLPVFALTLLTLAATLPALGDMNYLKKNYTYLQKIPIKEVSSYTNNTGRETSNLIDNDKNTEWISWIENVIWAEDYSKDRYFKSTAIDGANATTSVISNNTLSLAAIPASTTQDPTSRVWRQYQLFNDGNDSYPNEMSNLKAGLYTLKIKYRGTVAAENGLRVYLGNGSGSVGVIHDDVVSTDWIEKEIPLELPGDVATGAVCCVQPGHYPGTLEVESAELSCSSSEQVVYTKDYSKYEPDYTFTGATLENGILVATKGEPWYQFDMTPENFKLKPNTSYKVTVKIKGENGRKNVPVWVGSRKQVNGKDVGYIDTAESLVNLPAYTQNFADQVFEFTTNDDVVDFDISPAVLRLQPARIYQNVDKIEIQSITIEEIDGPTITYDYLDEMKWPYKAVTNGNQDYIPSLVTEGGKTVAKVTNPKTGDYSFRLDYDFTIPVDYYTFKTKINAEKSGNLHIMIGSIEGGVKEHFVIELNPSQDEYTYETENSFGGSGYWIVCQPIGGFESKVGDYDGNFTIESLELIAKTSQTITTWAITNNGTNAYGGDSEYREVKDGVIYSYPLPTTRKVIIATGDGGHNGEQYNNLSGFDFQNDRLYTVSYKIKSNNGGSVTTLLASNTSLNGLNGGDWNTANAIGKSEVVELQPGIEKTVYTSIRTNGTTNNWGSGAVVLDLHYNLGQVEVTDLKVCDNYDENLGNHESRNITVKSESESKSSTDNFVTTQFHAIENFSFQQGVNYKINVTLKASEPGQLCIKIGDYGSTENRIVKYQTFAGNGDWETLVFDFANNGNNSTSSWVTLQVQKQNPADPNGDGLNQYSGTVDFESLMLYHDEQPEELVKNWNFKGKDKFDCYVMGYEPKIENGVLVSQNNAWHQFRIIEGLPLDKNTSYKLYTRLKGQFARDNAINVQFGTWRENENVNKLLDIPSVMKENAVVFGRPVVDNNDITFQIGESYTGRVEYENFRLTKNPAQNIDRYVVFPELTGIPNSPNSEYRNMSFTSDGLEVKPQGIPLTLFDNLTFDINRDYTVKLDIKVSHPGRYLVTLGDDNNISSGEIVVDESEVNRYVTKEVTIPVVTAQSGKMSLVPQVYTQSLSVQNYTLSYSTPQFDGASLRGTNFFDVKLEDQYDMDQDGKYLFHIGYANGSDATPRKMVILGSKENNGRYDILGEYEVENASIGNALISTVNDPLNIADSGIKYLRFFCSANNGEFRGVCFPKNADGNNDLDNAYIGNMMRMTSFAIYRQDEISDPQGSETATWAVPLITRFQIETNGVKYAYPGPALRDMIGISKSYSNTAEFYDGNTRNAASSYWDTTLPYIIHEVEKNGVQLPASGGQSRRYDADGIDHESTPNDFIDLLFPHLEDLRASQKYGGYQLYVSLMQGKGTIGDQYPEYRTYENIDSKYLNKANGFPIEISYQGFKYEKDDSGVEVKVLQGSPTVVLLFTNEETDPYDNNQRINIARFAINADGKWDGVRITCRENIGDLARMTGKKTKGKKYDSERYTEVVTEEIYDTEIIPNTRMMRFGDIQAYVEIPKINLEPKDNVEPYPYHLLYNSREEFKSYGWNHTRGIVDDINNENWYVPEDKDWQEAITKSTNKTDLEKHNIALPNFDFYANPFKDPDIPVSENDGYEGNGPRQRTYTILHEVQVLPGERVDLYPQSDIWNNRTGINYEEQFVRWYDYLTDNAPDYLYFFSEPKSVIKTENMGFISGKTLLDHDQRGLGTVASVYFKESDKTAFENSGEDQNKYYKKENGETRLKDQWVAADFSLTFNNQLAKRLGKDADSWVNKESIIQEPIINFRHLFHLISGKSFADKNMADAKGNRAYYKNNRRYLTSFGKKDFMIRLEKDMPEEADTKSAYYYYKDGKYKRVRGFQIRRYDVTKYNETELTYNGSKITNINLGGDNTFHSIERSRFNHITSNIQTDVESAKWLENGLYFRRAIGCDSIDATPGTYLVRIYGNDENGVVINLPKEGGGEEPLVIAEYQITFLDPKKHEASFLKESELKEQTDINIHPYVTHKEEYLESQFNKDKKSSLVVNFDNYTYLKNAKYKEYEFFNDASKYSWKEDKGVYSKDLAASYLKLPIAWDDSNYGFGYTTRGDYNMFVLADHSSVTPYKEAADAKPASDNPIDIETGVAYSGTYDRLFYNSGGTQKGLFYYVNAASDPGEMAKIQFGELCSGSTIYVSAWVNEFNKGQEETANVIFNFYANVHKKDDPDKKTIRQDQIHGFVTGYINRGIWIGEGNPNNYREGGDQGNWMHVYYTFVPDLSLAEYDSSTEAVETYTLVLENNCISSAGADYAIDDIRAYVVAPRVEVSQVTPLCSREQFNDIDVEIMIPYQTLYESMKGSIVDGKMQLQYSILDKKVYDNELDQAQTISTETYTEAFAKSVLHYPHENIQMSLGTNPNKPLSWGSIEFYGNFNDYFEKDEEGNIKYDDNKNPISKHTDLRSEGRIIDGEKMLVFKTRLFSTNPDLYYDDFNKDHKSFYIVIGNLGTDGIFNDVSDEYKPEGTYNADVYPENQEKWSDYDKVLATLYSLDSKCARMTDFKIKGASEIIVDGIVYNDIDNITCCENQRPVVQVDLYKKDSDGIGIGTLNEDDLLRATPYLDWYAGTYEDFMEAEMTVGETKTSLWQVLTAFRDDYPTSTTWDVPAYGEEGTPANITHYTSVMKQYLKELCEGVKDNDGKYIKGKEPKLQLYQASYVFPNLVLGYDKEGKKKLSEDFYVTAVPINSEDESEEYIVCSEPTEINITVTNRSPMMNNGFASDNLTYPDGMDIVPLRLGLKHTDKSSAAGDSWNTVDKSNITIAISKLNGNGTLVMPLRNLAIATEGVTKFKTVSGDPFCYLAETNDPSYRQLGQVAFKAPSIASNGSSENSDVSTQAETSTSIKYDSDFGLVPRGLVTVDAQTDNNYFSNVTITFNSADMLFHEGYYYTFKFPYEEDYTDVDLTGIDKESMPCHGETYFTIKVVPEYQVWTGKASLNWNNDENWRRVSGDSDKDVLPSSGGNLSSKTYWKDRYTAGGENANTFSYAPLDFTKVIIPAGSTYPQLAARAHDRKVTGEGVSIKNGHGDAAVSYVWEKVQDGNTDYNSNAPKAATADGNESVADANEDGTEKTPSYLPTFYIQYDMAATTYSDANNVYCRPWYANACEQIHFNSNAEILNQQNLDYQKAWVDMEMKPHQWYNVASPLYGVVAGDMYLPKVDARQATELFTDINFSTTLNDRFHPAVYQRGWDKGSETVYNLTSNSTNCPKEESVALASTWSHVYNDVTEAYAPGMGFSVKTDVSRIDNFGGLVKFRFPKADTSYEYFEDKTNGKHDTENGSSIDRSLSGRMLSFSNATADTTVTLTKAREGQLFLVGNPFMAHLDMAKFLEKNADVINEKFWILSEGTGQVGVVMDRKNESNMLTNMTAGVAEDVTIKADYSRLAPMQGFFVQAKTAGNKTDGNSVSIKFSPDMMAVKPYAESDGLLLKAPARGTRADEYDIINVSTPGSSAIIRLDENADKGYAASEDVEMIDDSSQRGLRRVYTIAGNMATAINQTPDADGVEVGLMAPADSVTTVTLNGLVLEDYLLYDMETGEMTPLYDGFTIEMKGSVSGRYFITRGVNTSEIEDGSIRIRPQRDEIVVTAPLACGALTVRVYDTLGREVAKAEGMEQGVRIQMAPGIYVVDVQGEEKGRRSAKVSL